MYLYLHQKNIGYPILTHKKVGKKIPRYIYIPHPDVVDVVHLPSYTVALLQSGKYLTTSGSRGYSTN